MSKFSNTAEKRVNDLTMYMLGVMKGEKGGELVKKYGIITENYIPQDILSTFDVLFEQNVNIEDMKTVSNKLFNILYKTLSNYPAIKAQKSSFINLLEQDNAIILQKLKDSRKYIKELNVKYNVNAVKELILTFKEFEKFTLHYTVKENILFPILEQKWEQHQCVKLMWSFHDDIRRNIKKTLELLEAKNFDLTAFNKISSVVFFNINTIIFREEKVLFPIMLETIKHEVLENMLEQTVELGLPFVEVEATKKKIQSVVNKDDVIKFATGEVSVQQIEMIFNHLPVDITYVDENDTVRFFSDPVHRIFPRTASIVGRKLQNCHPPESVHIVDKIVESFKSGEKNVASFWLHLGPKYVLIQYFAVRNKNNEYKGVLEVSQEISEIQKIEGDRKLLDW